MLDARLAEMQALVDAADGRHRSQTTELSRAIGAAMQQMQDIGEERDEAQLQIDSVASNQREIERSLQSVIHEYNSMLNDHEQAIRTLGERQAVMETQAAAAAAAVGDGEKQRHASRRQQRLQPQRNHPPASAPPQQLQYESIGDILETDRLDSMMTAMMMYPDKRRASGTRDSSADGLDLSFPSPPLSTTSADCYHHQTLPNNYSLHQELGETTLVLDRSPMRKATSVVGTSNEPRRKLSPPPRLRARNSSFSRLAEIDLMNKTQHNQHQQQHASLAQMILVSPTRPAAASGFSNIISTTSHVGVGWGNYWEARRHRLQFDIQKRF
ncbi:hypothetical protein GGI11_009211, partial [Coemansia sp. RSA 2049]